MSAPPNLSTETLTSNGSGLRRVHTAPSYCLSTFGARIALGVAPIRRAVLPQRSMASLVSRNRVCDLVQHGEGHGRG